MTEEPRNDPAPAPTAAQLEERGVAEWVEIGLTLVNTGIAAHSVHQSKTGGNEPPPPPARGRCGSTLCSRRASTRTDRRADGVIRPRVLGWQFAQRESQVFEQRERIPTWKLADKSRRILADTLRQLSSGMPAEGAPWSADEFATGSARENGDPARLARGPELFGPDRAYLVRVRGRGLWTGAKRVGRDAEDKTGQRRRVRHYARRVLCGRAPRNLKALAEKHGSAREIKLLDKFAHSEVRMLLPLSDRDDREASDPESRIDLHPTRGQVRPAAQLHEVSYVAVHAAVGCARSSASAYACRRGSRASSGT